MSGLGSPAPVRARRYSPSEFSGALAEIGIGLCADRVRQRCNLPSGHSDHISTLPTFAGRHWIPESELFRLAGLVEVSR